MERYPKLFPLFLNLIPRDIDNDVLCGVSVREGENARGCGVVHVVQPFLRRVRPVLCMYWFHGVRHLEFLIRLTDSCHFQDSLGGILTVCRLSD